MKNNGYDIAIAGAGAAGLMAAIAARGTLKIAVLEKNEKAGKKLYATGNGRCNLLNRSAAAEDYRSAEGDAPGFAAEVFGRCDAADLQAVFASLGLDTVEEGEGRLYPRSLQAASVVHALERGAFGKSGAGTPAQFLGGFELKTVVREADGTFCLTAADGREIFAKRLILTTGGKAGIQYGCDGRGYKIAESLGHRIVRPIPALTGFVLSTQTPEFDGVRTQAAASIFSEARIPGEKAFQRTLLGRDAGEVQFSAGGISGICCMNVSRWLRMADGVSFVLSLDLFPEYETEALTALFAERLALLSDRGRLLEGLLCDKLVEYVRARTQNASPAELAARCKDLRFALQGTRGWPDSQTTAGGVRLSEIDPKEYAVILKEAEVL